MPDVFSETRCPRCPFPYADYILTRNQEESIFCPFCGYSANGRWEDEDTDEPTYEVKVVDVCLGSYGYEAARTYASSSFRSEEHRQQMIETLSEPDNGLLAAWYTEKREDGFFYRVVIKGEPRYAYYESNNPEDGFGVRDKEAMESENTYRSDEEIQQMDEEIRRSRKMEDDLPF